MTAYPPPPPQGPYPPPSAPPYPQGAPYPPGAPHPPQAPYPPQVPHPPGAPHPPQGAPYPPPPPAGGRPHRSYTRTIVIVSLVLLVCGGGAVAGSIFAWQQARSLGEPAPTPSAVSDGPIYRNLPSACSMPAKVVRSLVPSAEETNEGDRKARPDIDEGPLTHCQWDMSVAEGKRRKQTRTLKVTVTGYLDGDRPGADRAKLMFDSALDIPRKYAGKTDNGFTYGEVERVDGLGQEAYRQDLITRVSYTYGGTRIWALIDNLVIEVSYDGADNYTGKSTGKPMPTQQARTGAETVARELAKLVTSCADCRS